MPFRVTEPCNRFLEASHDPAEVIRQMRAGPLSDIVGQAVKGFGHSAGMADLDPRVRPLAKQRRPPGSAGVAVAV